MCKRILQVNQKVNYSHPEEPGRLRDCADEGKRTQLRQEEEEDV